MSYKQKIPSSRVNITYDIVSANNEKKKKELPLKILIMGDFSLGESKEMKKSYYDRTVLNGKGGVNAVLSKLDISKTISVNNRITPHQTDKLDIDLQLKNINAFSPLSLANQIPALKKLLRLKEIVANFETTFDNNRAFQEKIREMLANAENKEIIKKSLVNIEEYNALLNANKHVPKVLEEAANVADTTALIEGEESAENIEEQPKDKE